MHEGNSTFELEGAKDLWLPVARSCVFEQDTQRHAARAKKAQSGRGAVTINVWINLLYHLNTRGGTDETHEDWQKTMYDHCDLTSGDVTKACVAGLASLRPVKLRLYDVTMVFFSPLATSFRSHWPMHGPQALASTTPPTSRKICACAANYDVTNKVLRASQR